MRHVLHQAAVAVVERLGFEAEHVVVEGDGGACLQQPNAFVVQFNSEFRSAYARCETRYLFIGYT
jgi:hypothetical protein